MTSRSGGVDLREDDGSNIFVVELVILEFRRTKETIGKPPARSDGDGSQKPLAGNVADGSDTGNIGVLIAVNGDVTLGSGFDTNVLQTEVLGIGMTTDCPQENVGLDLVALVGVNGQITRLTFDLGDVCLSVEVYTGMLHPGGKDFLDGRVESSEDGVTTDEEVGLGSEGVEDTGKFYGDVTSTDDDDSFRLVFEGEETIRSDAEASSGNFLVRGDGRVAADGDADVIGLDGVGFLTRLRDLDLSGG